MCYEISNSLARTTICILLLLVSGVSAQTRRDVAIPDTPAGKQLEAWLKVFASGDQGSFERFIAQNYSKTLLSEDTARDRADRQARTYLDARAFHLRSVEKTTEGEITVLAQAALTNLWFRLTMKVETTPPYQITEYTSQRIHPPAGTFRKLSERELVLETSRFLNKLAAADAFSGTLLMAKNGKPIFKTAHGLASKAYNIHIRPDTKLNVASIGKMFTAIAVGQLAEQGKLSFSDTIGKHLVDYPEKQVAQKVSIHHLLSHSSGLGDFHGAKYVCLEDYLKEAKDYFPLFVNEPLSFKPGTRWQYSNAGYMILAVIIEKISGENFFDYVRKHIFKPAGMVNTDYYEADVDTPNLAMGYTNFVDIGNDYLQFHLGPRRNTSHYGTVRGGPAGGAYSTLDDLLRFSLALRGNKLLSAKYTDLMTSTKILARKYDAGQTFWGYGFELEEINGKRVIGHGGGDMGISSGVRWYPDSGNYTLIVLSNYDRGGILANYKIQELIIQNSLVGR
jgi:CubicO group peptidase (beta-lactamase class C family)